MEVLIVGFCIWFVIAVVRQVRRDNAIARFKADQAALKERIAVEKIERRLQREEDRQTREAQRATKAKAAANLKTKVAQREAETERRNRDVEKQLNANSNLLKTALGKPIQWSWSSLHAELDQMAVGEAPREPKKSDFAVRRPTAFKKLVPGWQQRHQARLSNAKQSFVQAHAQFVDESAAYQMRHVRLLADMQHRQTQAEALQRSFAAGQPEAVSLYFEMVLACSKLPAAFPINSRCVYLPESRQLLIDFELPTIDAAIPSAERYRYVKAKDEVVEVPRAPKLTQAAYSDLVAQAVLRRIYEAFAADKGQHLDVVAINASIATIDPASGKPIRPCVASVRTTRPEFDQLDLRHVDPIACLRNLKAAVSRSPGELVAVKPVVDLNMADPRFIQEADVLGNLDSRPNLMDLTPGEFENLITNLFQKMGLETKLTQASRDGGVDCVAYDPRPVLGGKVVIQAKRYKNVVGVSAVRDLFGTMHNEGASKGILVTTSDYGRASFDFANGKPLELLNGQNLLYLLKEHAGIDARIIVPEDWSDPKSDAA